MHRVELKDPYITASSSTATSFLMYRVELKVWRLAFNVKHELSVPNVPCGVERRQERGSNQADPRFLMYRVELKVFHVSPYHQYK